MYIYLTLFVCVSLNQNLDHHTRNEMRKKKSRTQTACKTTYTDCDFSQWVNRPNILMDIRLQAKFYSYLKPNHIDKESKAVDRNANPNILRSSQFIRWESNDVEIIRIHWNREKKLIAHVLQWFISDTVWYFYWNVQCRCEWKYRIEWQKTQQLTHTRTPTSQSINNTWW